VLLHIFQLQGYEHFNRVFAQADVWRYEKLPIAGDFLSSYTKAEAGYNP
jgi:hypothetical protein